MKNKQLITISGAPGSGKSLVAIKLLAHIVTNMKLTAKLQIPGPEFRSSVKKAFQDCIFSDMIGGSFSTPEQDVIILDEAHKQGGRGSAKQFYDELFKTNKIIIAFIDDNQVIAKKGFLKQQVVESSKKFGYKNIHLNLKEQFRNQGDYTYIDWLENWILQKNNQQIKFINNKNKMKFKVLNGKEFGEKYRELYMVEITRMASFWTQPWSTKLNDGGMPVKNIKIAEDNYCWNVNSFWVKELKKHYPETNLTKEFKKILLNQNFNTDKKGMEYVAYFNTIQGAEFNNIFVHLPKLFFLNDNKQIDVDLSQLELYDMKTQIWMKNNKPNPEKEEENKRYFLNRLIVNLTRGIKSYYIYCDDPKLQKHILNMVE